MKVLKAVLLGVAVLVAVLLLVGLALPRAYHVERSVRIRATPDRVYPLIAAFRRWPDWIAWTTNRYPDMEMRFGETDTGVGAGYSWTGKSSGDGAIRFTRLDPGRAIGYALDFEQGRYLSTGEIRIEPAGGEVTVIWTNEGDLGGNPLSRWFGLFMDSMMGPDFAAGLANLKQRAEAVP